MPKAPEYTTIDADAQLNSFRRDNARQKEIDAQLAEMTAEQVGASVEVYPGNVAAHKAAVAEAERARGVATEMHELAGTKPEDFVDDVAGQLESRLQAIEQQHLLAVEKAEHPDAYGVDREQAEWDRTVADNGLKVLRERIEALDAPSKEAK